MVKAHLGEGEKQPELLVDSGASVNILSSEWVPKGFKPTKAAEQIQLVGFSGGNTPASSMNFCPIRVGMLTTGIRFYVSDQNQEPGILGSPFLKKHQLVIDLSNNCLWQMPNEENLILPVYSVQKHHALREPDDIVLCGKEKWVTEFPLIGIKNRNECGKIDAEVLITGPDPKPQKQYRYPAEAEKAIAQIIDSLVEQDVLVQMESINNAPIWPVKKKDNTYRLVIDFRHLNAAIPCTTPIVSSYPEVIAAIAGGAKWFSVIDIANCFFSIPLAPPCWYKFAFTFRGRQYCYKRLPQGLHLSPSICHKHVTQMLDKLALQYREATTSYVDDILLWGQTADFVRDATRAVLKLLQETGFKINWDKAQLVQQEVKYLGVRLGQEGRTPDAQRVEAIGKLPAPTDAHSLRAILGTLNFSREFIEGFAEKTRPLWALLKKNRQWEWGPDQAQALVQLKQDLAQAPALAYPRVGEPFMVQLASSETAIGATLIQKQEGKKRVIAYASKPLSGVEQNFTPCERECLALFWCLQQWEYIIGDSKIIVQTTHSPLQYIVSGKIQNGHVSNPRIAQWTLALVNRGIQVEKGKVLSPVPYGLITEGEGHTCPLPEYTHIQWPVKSGLTLEEALEKNYKTWFIDGSSYFQEGKAKTGFGIIRVNDQFEKGAAVLPHSAQAAEVAALKAVLATEDKINDVAIFTDSEWVRNAFLIWLPIWRSRHLCTSDGKPVAHAEMWEEIANHVKHWQGDIFVMHVKAHQKVKTGEAFWNDRADILAKRSARTTEVVDVVTRAQRKKENNPAILDLATLQKDDVEIQELLVKGKSPCGKYTIQKIEEAVWAVREDLRLWVVPKIVRSDLIQYAHEQGHFGWERTLTQVKAVGWWPLMKQDVKQWCNNCLRCAMVNADTKIKKGDLRHQRPSGVWSDVQIDYIGPLPRTKNGNQYCLVLVDSFSKWIEAIPTKDNTAKTTARHLLNQVFVRLGIPKGLNSDRGSHFTGEVMQELCQLLGIKQRYHISHHPQSSGAVERQNRVIKESLKKLVRGDGKDWDQKLPLILMALRSSPASHGYTPFEVVTGRLMNTPPQWWLDTEIPDEWQPRVLTDQWIQQLSEKIAEVQKDVAVQLGLNIKRMDKYLGWVKNPIEWSVGTKVMYRDFSKKKHSLTPNWQGPCYIVDRASPTVYLVEIKKGPDDVKKKWFHSSQLKAWKGK